MNNGKDIGRNFTLEIITKLLDNQNIQRLARSLQDENSSYDLNGVTECWIEAVLIELIRLNLIKMED